VPDIRHVTLQGGGSVHEDWLQQVENKSSGCQVTASRPAAASLRGAAPSFKTHDVVCFLSDAAEQVLLIDSAYWAAAAVGGERLISALVSAKKNRKMYACAVCYCSLFLFVHSKRQLAQADAVCVLLLYVSCLHVNVASVSLIYHVFTYFLFFQPYCYRLRKHLLRSFTPPGQAQFGPVNRTLWIFGTLLSQHKVFAAVGL
jgi:hypothetical protein